MVSRRYVPGGTTNEMVSESGEWVEMQSKHRRTNLGEKMMPILCISAICAGVGWRGWSVIVRW